LRLILNRVFGKECEHTDCTEMGGSGEDQIMDFGKPGDYSLMRMHTHTPCIIPQTVAAW
jgi:hypothetical protein